MLLVTLGRQRVGADLLIALYRSGDGGVGLPDDGASARSRLTSGSVGSCGSALACMGLHRGRGGVKDRTHMCYAQEAGPAGIQRVAPVGDAPGPGSVAALEAELEEACAEVAAASKRPRWPTPANACRRQWHWPRGRSGRGCEICHGWLGGRGSRAPGGAAAVVGPRGQVGRRHPGSAAGRAGLRRRVGTTASAGVVVGVAVGATSDGAVSQGVASVGVAAQRATRQVAAQQRIVAREAEAVEPIAFRVAMYRPRGVGAQTDQRTRRIGGQRVIALASRSVEEDRCSRGTRKTKQGAMIA